jgi:DNA protecting protein DprA
MNIEMQKSFFDEPDSNTNIRVSDSERDSILINLFALLAVSGIGAVTIRKLNAQEKMVDIWREIDQDGKIKSTIKNELIQELRTNKGKYLDIGYRKKEELSHKGVQFFPKGHRYYPEKFLHMEAPPDWIFALGNIDLLSHPGIVTVVGSRDASSQGLRLSYEFAKELVRRDYTVLSGLARGIDEEAHLGALDHFGLTIGVLGHGLEARTSSRTSALWNRIVAHDGLLVSEYMPDSPPSKNRFLRRNEIQVILSDAVVPIETISLASGTWATIRRAERFNVPVLGVSRDGLDTKNLQQTHQVLRENKHNVYSLDSGDIWLKLDSILEMNKPVNNQARQHRFFQYILSLLEQNRKRLDLDMGAIEDLQKLIGESFRGR